MSAQEKIILLWAIFSVIALQFTTIALLATLMLRK